MNVLRGAGDVNTSAVAGILRSPGLELIGRIKKFSCHFLYTCSPAFRLNRYPFLDFCSSFIESGTPLAWAMGASVPIVISDSMDWVSGLTKIGNTITITKKPVVVDKMSTGMSILSNFYQPYFVATVISSITPMRHGYVFLLN